MSEDFGFGGDEAWLSPHQFALELHEMRAMQWEQEQDCLRELAEKNKKSEPKEKVWGWGSPWINEEDEDETGEVPEEGQEEGQEKEWYEG